ncbi:hypothetical protein SAMN05428949_0590 [Chitinophaga sp. YR627]|uniref:hypothetical protein n=1 Tax=Chitinophaga sp. YR627 TaxID=1881041 RepID=UPI0008E09332|nr:hypothetical protein [Chitinophaga sp. YR627]SFM72930.1 hypothetical protein SAMN05428949_0590 [Chitinophaga sp. YR627]
MYRITTFETVEQKINEIPGTPTVLEAIWDGDSDGWHLLLYLYTVATAPSAQADETHYLGQVVLPEGSPSFTGDRWNECIVAEEIGNKAAKKYNLTFYFPSNMHPDDDCPSWPDKHLGVSCTECGKLLLPGKSEYIPDDICQHCHGEQEDNKDIKEQRPLQPSARLYLLKDDRWLHGSVWSENATSYMAEVTRERIKNLPSGNVINILQLSREEIAELKNNLEKTLDRLLDAYEMPVIDEQRKRFARLYKFTYKDKTYELMGILNHNLDRIADLADRVAITEQAITGDYDFVIYFSKGITHRDDSFLRFLRIPDNIARSLAAINKEYAYLLTKAEITETLERLKTLGCITINGDQVSITQVGERIL